MNISVIGVGVYSLAITSALLKNKNNIKIWSHSNDLANEFNNTGMLRSIIDVPLDGVSLVSENLSQVLLNSDIIYVVTTSEHFTNMINEIKQVYNGCPVCILTKGIDNKTGEFFSNLASDILNTNNIAILSGPGFANDIINNDIISLTLASSSADVINKVSTSIASEKLILDYTKDIVGLQLCNSVKNIAAIASGMLESLDYTNSSNAFLITKVTNDLMTLLGNYGCEENTVLLAGGLGDLILTCSSDKSRNYLFGKNFINNRTLNTNDTVEGVCALNSLYHSLKSKDIKMNLIDSLYEIIYNYKDVDLLIDYLSKKE
ncbi:MAG: NAD(P)H-dependent glycerol-3-phosphate dehydrogenase [bacterium]